MRNAWLIARREYLERVRTKAFVISLILLPALMALFIGVPAYISEGSGNKNIVVVTADAALGQALVQELASDPDSSKIHATVDLPTEGLREQLNDQVQTKKINGYLWLAAGNTKPAYYSNSAGDLELAGKLQRTLQQARARAQLTSRGMPGSEIQSLFATVDIDMLQVSNGKKSNALRTYIGSLVLMFLLYFSLVSQGFNVSRSVIEEKTSRIFEVMLATVTPQEMLAGKLLGVGAVGLTQMGIWLLAGLILSGPGLASMHASAQFSLHLSAMNLIAFVLCFLLGFLFYSSLSAMLGAMVNSEQELQQLNLFLTLPLILCLAFFNIVLSDPSGTLATVLSLLPPFAPLLMYLRIAVQMPPVWQLALSLALMIGGVWLVLWLASRIYRVGILMYGKRPTLPELLHWLKYS